MRRIYMFCLGSAFQTLLIISFFVSQAQATLIDFTPNPGEFVGIDPYAYEVEVQRVYISKLIDTSLIITDNNEQLKSGGIFSGYDLTSVFIDIDGLLSTQADQFFPDSYTFMAGSVRDKTDVHKLPNADHPGPTYGAFDSNTIDYSTARFDELETIISAVVTNDGPLQNAFLSLGDGGILGVNFQTEVLSLPSFYLILGEGGGGEHVTVTADVCRAPAPVPEPATMLLFGTGLVGLVGSRLRRKNK